ncbi:hypothetical protein WR25_19851 [Diploscapter pachys]|uniref:Dolichyl-diphosphooligosaccharide--protein glycosyltransferase subunit 1 n=1 Tax=Diploscapter pachys TaxID=2018661 RepID=A0A2A2JN05_9BILA|nr:hypothetical protein WR25_19851 [Diploscapter pachys]
MWVRVLAGFLAVAALTQGEGEWKVTDVDRTVDLTSQVIKVQSTVTFENVGASEQNSVKIVLSEKEDAHLAYLQVQEDGSQGKLRYTKDKSANHEGFQVYKVELLKRVPKGGALKLKIAYRVTQSLKPLPTKIEQSEQQFVIYEGNAYFAAAYPVAKEKSNVKLPTGKLLSATTHNPSKQETERLTYGPYADQPAFNSKPINVHFENNAPFLVATVVERVIEISHWGNIAVEEYVELEHRGAELKGTFSRIDFQMDRRGRRQPAVQQWTTVLPATAKDIYYRDEIGNISTSGVRVRADSVDVEIKPRYPLFGGWRTSYVIGYNVPSYEYLYKKGNDYALRVRLLDHVMDNIVVEKLTTKVIIPELARNIKIVTPYTVDRRPDELKKTYLDVSGRTVLVVQKDNLVNDHIQMMTVSYEFTDWHMLYEPLYAVGFFLAFFLFVIFYVRLDFSMKTNQ